MFDERAQFVVRECEPANPASIRIALAKARYARRLREDAMRRQAAVRRFFRDEAIDWPRCVYIAGGVFLALVIFCSVTP